MSIGGIRRKPYRKVCMMQTSCRAFLYLILMFCNLLNSRK